MVADDVAVGADGGLDGEGQGALFLALDDGPGARGLEAGAVSNRRKAAVALDLSGALDGSSLASAGLDDAEGVAEVKCKYFFE